MALGFMRRHRRWLFGFLWLVILAFIILYIPAFQGDERAGARPRPWPRSRTARSRSASTSGRTCASAQMYQSMYQGRMNDEMLRRLGLEEQALQGLVDERMLAAGGGAAGHPRGRRDAEAARRHRARVPAGRPIPGRGRDPQAAGACRA